MKQSVLGLYYEDFVVGEEIKHALSKTIFESDNNFFSLLTMNHHPVHTNVDYASHNQHGQILVVGTLVFSLVAGMTVPACGRGEPKASDPCCRAQRPRASYRAEL